MRMHRLRLTILCASLIAVLGPGGAHAATGDITLLGQLLPQGMNEVCDVWGYVDPMGVDYAIIGDWGYNNGGGVYIINVEDPSNPFLAKSITGLAHSGFDVKVWSHYIYACKGTSSGVSYVYDIADIQNPVISAPFAGMHNIAIHRDGYLYQEVPGLQAYSLISNPMSPSFMWATDYGDGHDAYPIGDFLFDFHGYSGTRIYNITNRTSAPVLLGQITDPAITYHHSGCPSKDGHYLYVCDELADAPSQDFTVWDLSNIAAPVKVGGFGDNTATVHNLYIVGDFAFVSYYSAGFRVFDVSNPAAPVLLDTHDTSASTGENYDGCFGVYPFAQSGVIYASDYDNGLFLFSVEGIDPVPTAVGGEETPRAGAARLVGNYPNPFNPATTVAFELDRAVPVRLAIYDANGQLVTVLVDGARPAGRHETGWDGTDRAGARVASGVYFARLEAGGRADSKRLVLLK